MKKLIDNLLNINKTSKLILNRTIIIWLAYMLSYMCLKLAYINSRQIDLTLAVCVKQYPLLIFMSLSLGITGAILLDIYKKTQSNDNGKN